MKKIIISMLTLLFIISGICLMNVDGSSALATDTTATFKAEPLTPVEGQIPTCSDTTKEWIFAGWYQDEACEQAYYSFPTGGAAYAKFVPEKVLSVKLQLTEDTDANSPTTNMRLVSSVDSLNYRKVGFKVYFNGAETPINIETTKVYERIVASAESGVEYNYSPKVVNTESEYFVTATLLDINQRYFETGSFYIRPYWVTFDGTEVYGENRYVTVEDGYDTSIINMPVKMSSNPGDSLTVSGVENATVSLANYDGTYAHIRVKFTDETADRTSLASATTIEVTGAGVSGSGVYRNLLTTHVNPDSTTSPIADTTWYEAHEDDSAYIIATSAEFYGLAQIVNGTATDSSGNTMQSNFLNKTIYIVADLELNKGYANKETLTWDTTLDSDGKTSIVGTSYAWTRIGKGDSSGRFAGTFDGQMHNISGIYMETSEARSGLFAEIEENAVLKDFKLTNSYFNMNGTNYAGSIVGYVHGGTLDSIYSDALVLAGCDGTGGLFGLIDNGAVFTMNNCWFDGTVTASNRWFGGLIGGIGTGTSCTASVEITNCLNTGFIKGTATTSRYVGGLFGYSYAAANALVIKNSMNSGELDNSESSTSNQANYCLIGYYRNALTYSNVYATYESDASVISFFPGLTTEEDNVNAGIVYIDDATTGLPIAGINALTEDTKNLFTYVTDENTYANQSYWAITQGAPVLSAFADITGVQYQAVDTSWFRADKASFTLKDAADLYGLALLSRDSVAENFANETIYLGADIVMNEGITYDSNGPKDGATPFEWLTIGTSASTACFQGKFDGQGKTISGIYMQADAAYGGLFAAINTTSVLKSFKLTNSYFNMNNMNYVGSIVGYVHNGGLDSIYSDAFVLEGQKGVGGLCGSVDNAATTFKMNNCWFNGEVTASANWVGGLLGSLGTSGSSASGEITNCLNTGLVKGTADTSRHVGGLFGYSYAATDALVIKNSMNSGELDNSASSTTNQVNYFLIGNYGKAPSYSNVYATYESGASVISFFPGLTTEEDNVNAGIVYIDDATNGLPIAGAKALTTETKNLFTYVTNADSYANESYWAITHGAPVLSAFADVAGVQYQAVDTSWFRTDETSFTLTDAADLYGLALLSRDSVAANFANETIYLDADIVMNEGITYDVNGPKDDAAPIEWLSIGTVDYQFKGTFDGKCYNISGVYLNSTTAHSNGLFGDTSGATLNDFSLTDSYFNSQNRRTGSIAGMARGGTFKGIYSSAIVGSSDLYVGGLIGYVQDTGFTMDDCWFNGTVTGSATNSIGGLVGYIISSAKTVKMTNCLNSGTVNPTNSSAKYVGGLIGYCGPGKQMTLMNCLNTGTIVPAEGADTTAKQYGLISGYLQQSSPTVSGVYTTKQDSIVYAYSSTSAGSYTVDDKYMVAIDTIQGEDAVDVLSELFASKTTEGEDYWVITTTTPVLKTFEKIALGKTEG